MQHTFTRKQSYRIRRWAMTVLSVASLPNQTDVPEIFAISELEEIRNTVKNEYKRLNRVSN